MYLLREYASRPLQGRALEYEGLYRAMVCQHAEDERMSRISVVEFMKDASRSRTFASYKEFKTYLDHNLGDETLQRLIILEDLPVRFVYLLRSRLRIHPSIFARHSTTEDSTMI
jgi:UDP-3-O-acyl-N-acetylglucosamine deacetylase